MALTKARERLTALRLRCMRFLLSLTVNRLTALHANMNALRRSYRTACEMSDTQCRCSRSDRARSSRGYIRVMAYSSCSALAVHLVMMLPLDCSAVHIKARERLTALRLRCMRFLLSLTVNISLQHYTRIWTRYGARIAQYAIWVILNADVAALIAPLLLLEGTSG